MDTLLNNGDNVPVVKNYVKNAWSRFMLVRTMMNAKGIFFCKYSSTTVMEAMVEGGPWLIHNVSLILREWTHMMNISNENLKSVQDWVKPRDVPITWKEPFVNTYALVINNHRKEILDFSCHKEPTEVRKVSFKNALVVMTSNVSSTAIAKGRYNSIGFMLVDDESSASYDGL
ncbi:zinc knuckle CX2CX4HX4C containing protein [Tanacetum coccineum]